MIHNKVRYLYFDNGLSLWEVESILMQQNDPENEMGREYLFVSPSTKKPSLEKIRAVIKGRQITWQQSV